MIYVIGGSNIDLFAHSNDELVLKESNLGKVKIGFGGVARNIAENLSNFDHKVSLVTGLGNDYFATTLVDDLRSKGVELDYAVDVNDSQSTYLALFDQENDMHLAINDMDILNRLSKDDFNELLKQINDRDLVVFDANFNEELLEYLSSKINCYKAIDATSAIKLRRIKKFAANFNCIKMNVIEAGDFANIDLINDDDFIEAFKYFKTQGIDEVIISTKDGLYYGDKNYIYHYRHNANIDVVNASGAGDALMSGFIHGRYEGYDLDYQLKVSLSLALLTLKSLNNVAICDKTMVRDIAINSNIKGEVVYEYQNK